MTSLWYAYPGDRTVEFFLTSLLGAGLLSSVGWLVSRALPRRPASRHLVLFSALVSCLALPIFACISTAAGVPLILIPLLRDQQDAVLSAATALDADLPNYEPATAAPTTVVTGPPASPPTAAEVQSTEQVQRSSANCPTTFVVAADDSQLPPIAATSIPPAPDVPHSDSQAESLDSLRRIATGAMLAWAIGGLFALVRFALSCVQVVWLRRLSRFSPNASHQALLQEIAAMLRTRRVPQLLVSSRTIAPQAVGFGPSAIILPATLLGEIGHAALHDVLVHEAAHLQRGDQWTVLLQGLAGALYWPLVSVHGVNRELRRAREELCDNRVLTHRDAIHYGETLLRVAELLVQPRPVRAGVGIFDSQGALERRIAGMIDPLRNRTTVAGRRAACAVMSLFVAASVFASATRFANSETSAGAEGDATGEVADGSTSIGEAVSGASAIAALADQNPKSALDPDDPKLAGHFSGRVTGPDGLPLRGAEVYVAPLSDGLNGELATSAEAGPLAIRAVTDADGRFEFDAPDMTLVDLDGLPTRRRCLVSARFEGYGPDWIEIRGRTRSTEIRHPGLGTNLALQLAADDVPIQGRFLDADGKPIAGARVRLTTLMIPKGRDLDGHLDREVKASVFNSSPRYERSLYQLSAVPGLTVEARTDAEGRFTLGGLGRDRLAKLTVSSPNQIGNELHVMTRDVPDLRVRMGDADANKPLRPSQFIYGARFSLQLEQGRTISGVVRDRDSGEPIAGMLVGRGRQNFPRDGIFWNQTVTDKHGRFEIMGLDLSVIRWNVTAVSAPGMPYLSAGVEIEGDSPAAIECPRGIPFRLKLADEEGRPVEAEVTYYDVAPNPHAPRGYFDPCNTPLSRGARQADGTYQGFVVAGPGALFVKAADHLNYRPAHVDPKAFFAPGRSDWTAQEQISAYGTQSTVSISGGTAIQSDYAAIVLINPPPDSGPLDLSATVAKNASRSVTLIDPQGEPVLGVQTQGMTFHPYDYEPPLRAATFPLTGLNHDRIRRIKFTKDDRQLVGFLLARADGDTPYTVRMQPWGTITGRLVDWQGKPRRVTRNVDKNGAPISSWWSDGSWHNPPKLVIDIAGDPDLGDRHYVDSDSEGRFRFDKLVPGQAYCADIYGAKMGVTERVLTNLVVNAGEVRDLGDIRIRPGTEAEAETKTQD